MLAVIIVILIIWAVMWGFYKFMYPRAPKSMMPKKGDVTTPRQCNFCGNSLAEYRGVLETKLVSLEENSAADLAVIAALVSSFKNMEIAQDVLVLGEVGLTGEVRRVPHLGKRLKEAQAVGFKKFIIPAANLAEVVKMAGVFAVDNVEEALREIFPRKRS